MKKTSILSLFITSLVCFSCTTSTSVTVNPSVTPSASTSASVAPSVSATPSQPTSSTSAQPTASAMPSTSPSTTVTSAPVTSSCVDLTVGQVYDSTVFSMYCPPSVKVGSKQVYTVVGMELSNEITAIQGNTYTFHSVGPNIDKTFTSTSPTFQDIDTSVKFTFKGTESVTVPAGTYTAGILTSAITKSGITTNLTYWIAKNVGLVKVKSDTNVPYSGNISSLTELKSFTP